MKDTILITGGAGQIGTELRLALNRVYGTENVIVSDIKEIVCDNRFVNLDILDAEQLELILKKYEVTQIYHLAAVLSAKGESIPLKAWEINMRGLLNIFEKGLKLGVARIFYPSSIAVFGATTPKDNTPQHTVCEPSTVYGISKYAGELWAQYYFDKFQLDVRSVRFPGIISHSTMPGGGTTDYAVDIYHHAAQGKDYTCYLRADTALPMMYMPDAIQAILSVMSAPASELRIRTSYNIHGMSFTPQEVYESIKKYVPDFKISYVPDQRQLIADSWNKSLDDSDARKDWNWSTVYDLDSMTQDMLQKLKA